MTRPSPAERLLIELGIEAPGEIDLEAIAADRGVRVKYRPLDGCEARIVGDDRHAIVSVSVDSRPTRQRFSLAHELGHWHHHSGRCLFCTSDKIGNPETGLLNPERQADDYASDLILPDFMLRPMLAKVRRMTFAAASEIANEFDASLTATLLKIILTCRYPLTVVCHHKSGRRWFRRPDNVSSWWFPRRDLDKESFAHAILFDSAVDDTFVHRIPADAWFEFKGADRSEVTEQSIRWRDGCVLTILTLPDRAVG
jgi:Zn-dependent peptidase ImmA (M78 family)